LNLEEEIRARLMDKGLGVSITEANQEPALEEHWKEKKRKR
jgi:hypothetical protein